jgi:hypothetical protein
VRGLFPANNQLCMICAALIAGYGAFNELILKIKMSENGRLKDSPVKKMTLFLVGVQIPDKGGVVNWKPDLG